MRVLGLPQHVPAYSCGVTDVALNRAYDGAGRGGVLVKLSCDAWEFNFWATVEELAGLSSIREADWQARRCLHIGESAGAPVHWAYWPSRPEGERVSILVGHDEETWDIGLSVSVDTVDRVVAAVADGSWRR